MRWFLSKDRVLAEFLFSARDAPKLSATSREGKTLVIRIAEPGEILGLHAVVTGGRYELTVETMQPCQLDCVGRDDMLRFLKDHADAALRATQHRARDCSDAYGVARTIG